MDFIFIKKQPPVSRGQKGSRRAERIHLSSSKPVPAKVSWHELYVHGKINEIPTPWKSGTRSRAAGAGSLLLAVVSNQRKQDPGGVSARDPTHRRARPCSGRFVRPSPTVLFTAARESPGNVLPGDELCLASQTRGQPIPGNKGWPYVSVVCRFCLLTVQTPMQLSLRSHGLSDGHNPTDGIGICF